MLRRLTLSIATLVVALLFCQCDTTAPVGAPNREPGGDAPRTVIRIGSWNLEHLGARTMFQDLKRYPDSPADRTPEQLARLARFIEDLEVDVLAVQEVFGPAAMQQLLQHLGDDYRFALGTTGVYDKTRISPGFLWNRQRVQLLQCEEMLDFPSAVGELSVFHRKPVNAAFRVLRPDGKTGFDFRAITVHLKASNKKKDERKRSAEVKILADYLRELSERAGEDTDIVVLGDFNHTYGAPAHRVFTQGGCVQYVEPTPKRSPTIVWFDDPIDHVAVTAGIRDDVIPGTLRIHNQMVDYTLTGEALVASKAAWRKVYSDHFPVTIDLDGTVDGDPDATFAPTVHTLRAQASRQPGAEK